MLNMEELKDVSKIGGGDNYYVSLYLNVGPISNPKGDYAIRFKNMLRTTVESLDKQVHKKVEKDLEELQSYVLSNKRDFKNGLVIIASGAESFRKEYNLSVPIKSELIVDKTPYVKPLIDIMDNYKRYAIFLVNKESARVFIVHLGEITEYAEVHTEDVPGKHKKGGWFALSQNHFDRHIEYHVGIHLKDSIKKLESFLEGQNIESIILGGPDDAISMTKAILPKSISERVIGTFHEGMFESNLDVLKKAEPLLREYERKIEAQTVEDLITKAMKNGKAVIGLEKVLGALKEGRIMKLVFEADFKASGLECISCGGLSALESAACCPYCSGSVDTVNYIVDMAVEKAVEQGASVDVVSENKKLEEAGGIGAFLRY